MLVSDFFFCNDYLNQFTFYFKDPKSSSMSGICLTYSYVMGWIFLTFIIVFVTYYEALLSAGIRFFSNGWYTARNLYHHTILQLQIDKIVRGGGLRFKHFPNLEFAWTIIPMFLLIFMAWPSFTLLFSIDDSTITPLYNIIVTGHQWFWSYEYSDFNIQNMLREIIDLEITKIRAIKKETVNFFTDTILEFNVIYLIEEMFTRITRIVRKISIDCNNLGNPSLPLGYPRLLSTDNVLVIPCNVPLRFLVTSSDVIHSWAIPSYGIKIDAVPGRLNQVFLNTNFCGTSWGQCSELCGIKHGYMPIEMRVVPIDIFLFFIKLKGMELIKELGILLNR